MLTNGKHRAMRRHAARMMLSALACCVFCVHAVSQTRDDILKEYLAALENCDIQTKIEECDFILGSCDSASLQETALKVFTHFRDSKLMGDENVAVHVAEKWMLPFCGDGADSLLTAERSDSVSLPDIRNYVEFNRESLLGAKAPLLPEAGLDAFPADRPTVLWFFDTDCAKCSLESVKLADFFSRRNDCSLTTFYIGDDLGKWKDFISRHFSGIDGARHLSDPAGATDFRRKYSVTATPRMFLIDREGNIAGRMLDTESMETLLDGRRKREKAAVTELFYQLVPLRGEDAKNSLEYLIDSRILCENSIFDTAEDSLMVVGFAQIQKDLLSRARPGTKIAGLKVKGSLNGRKAKVCRLDRLGSASGRRKTVRAEGMSRKEWKRENGKTVIVFHTRGCRQCEAELEAAENKSLNVFDIDVDDIQARYPYAFESIIDSFDLTALPFLVETDKNGIITHRYLSLL